MHKEVMVKRSLLLASVFLSNLYALAGIVEGKITDAESGEPLIDASITYADGKGVSTDIDGSFSLNLPNGKQRLTIRYIGYKSIVKEVIVTDEKQVLTIALEEEQTTLKAVTVTGEARHNTEAVQVREQQESHVTMTSVSEQHIKRTQDRVQSPVSRVLNKLQNIPNTQTGKARYTLALPILLGIFTITTITPLISKTPYSHWAKCPDIMTICHKQKA